MTLRLEFVELMPLALEEGVLYISMAHTVAIHKCACGCGEKVVTPLDPSGWTLTFDGKAVSLSPSIGNWNFSCRSHYFIIRNQVMFCNDQEYKNKKDKHGKNKKGKSVSLWKKVRLFRRGNY